MKKIILLLAVVIFTPVFASARTISLGEFLDHYTEAKNPLPSYMYIQTKYTNIKPNTYKHQVMQKVVYLDLIPNTAVDFPFNAPMTESMAASLIKKFDGIVVDGDKKPLTYDVMQIMLKLVRGTSSHRVEVSLSREYAITSNKEFSILDDVYNKMLNQHFDRSEFVKSKLVQGAIKGLAEATEDTYTSYFPPTESKSFQEGLNGEFVGIGAYVDLPKPGVFVITAPIEGGPADKAGLRAGDQVLKVDNFEISEEHDAQTIIGKIKGKIGTNVKLQILRNGNTFDVTIERDLIVIKSVTSEELKPGTVYIDLNMFTEGLYDHFLEGLARVDNIALKNTIILDLTDNPGGSLSEVIKILNHFVPAGKTSVVTKDNNGTEVIKAKSVDSEFFLGNKRVIIMVNGGSASASEILAGTIREYVDRSVIVGEKTFGKGSVQSLVQYYDNSLLKITTGKWFTGKNRTSIDEVGIEPDLEVIDDPETEQNEIFETVKRL